MNSLRQFAKNGDRFADSNQTHNDRQIDETIHILCVGPVDHSYMVHDVLLEVSNSQLSIVTDYREMWILPEQEVIHAVIIHNTLSLFELEEACRYIRQKWPRARILVVRSEASSLDDELYDDRVIPGVPPHVLLDTMERLTRGLFVRRSENVEP